MFRYKVYSGYEKRYDIIQKVIFETADRDAALRRFYIERKRAYKLHLARPDKRRYFAFLIEIDMDDKLPNNNGPFARTLYQSSFPQGEDEIIEGCREVE